MVMRVGGLATGMDIEGMVNKLMDAERIPLRRMEQDRTMLTWKQDAFRDINLGLSELDRMIFDMKLSRTYQTKNVQSTQANAVTATGGSQTSDGNYHIQVDQLATTAMNIGEAKVNLDEKIDTDTYGHEIKYYTFDENGKKVDHTISIDEDDTIGSVLAKITNDDSPVRAFADVGDDRDATRIILETTRTGQYNTSENNYGGAEIGFDEESFFTDVLHLTAGKAAEDSNGPGEIGGRNAKFTYNYGLDLESRDNSYTINNLNLEFHDTTDGHATLSVTNDVDHAFEQISNFVEKYNDIIDKLNGTQQEEKYRDYPPLTQKQRDEMSEDEIEKWEERAKSGVLRGERVIVDAMTNMRRGWYEPVNNDGAFKSMTEIGLNTSIDYMDGGKIIIDEDKLKAALRERPEDVQKLFANNEDGDRGLIYRLDNAVDETIGRINDHAGRATSTLDNYALGKRMKDLDQRIDSFQERLMKVEERYWNQFTQMEKAIQRMNEQSSYLFSQFNDGM